YIGGSQRLYRQDQSALDAPAARTHHKGDQLHVARYDAHGARGDLVLADRLPGPPDARVLQAQVDEDHREHHREQQVVVLDRPAELEPGEGLEPGEVEVAQLERIDARDALRPAGDVHRPR